MICPKCGGEYQEGVERCWDCDVDLVSERSESEIGTAPGRVPWVAAVLSLILPGAGQLYVGRPKRAALVFLGLAVLLLLLGRTAVWFAGLVTLLVCNLLYRIWAAVDAWRDASLSDAASLSWYTRWYACGLLAIVVGVASSPFVVSVAPTEAMYIPAASMEPVLQIGDRVVVRKTRNPKADVSLGDVVVFAFPERPDVSGVKRAVALPGQQIEIVAKQLFLDGERAEEPWAVFSDSATFPVEGVPEVAIRRDHLPPTVLPLDSVFLLGDNRDQSYDSRFFGPVAMDAIRGEVRYIYWSSDLTRVGRTIR